MFARYVAQTPAPSLPTHGSRRCAGVWYGAKQAVKQVVTQAMLATSLCWVTSLAQANDMLPFEQVRQQYRTTNDLTRVSHLYRRCAALQLNVAALLVKKKQRKAATDYENLANHYMMLSEATDIEIDKKRGVKTVKPMETISLSVKGLTELYEQRMKDNRAKRGESFAGDSVLEDELAQCLKPDAFVKSLTP